MIPLAQILQIGGSLVAILLLAWIAHRLGLGGDTRIRSEDQARELADEAVSGFEPVDIAIDRAGMRAFLACLARRQLRQRGARSDIGAAPPAVDGRRVVRPGHGHRRSRIPVGRIETVAAAFELQNAQTRHALPREALAQAVGHRAKILADHNCRMAARLETQQGQEIVSRIGEIDALCRRRAIGHEPEPDEAHHMIDPYAAGIAQRGAQCSEEGGVSRSA